jgi:hypothetical protein
MPQLTHSQPQILRVRSRHRRFLAVAVVMAGVATSALLVISEQDKAPPAPGGVVSDSPSAGVSHDGGYYRTLSRRALSQTSARTALVTTADPRKERETPP